MGADKSELFDEESDQEERDADEVHLQVNQEYAKRFEYNKKRADLHRLQEKHPEVAARIQARGLDGDDDGGEASTSEEEDEGQLHPETDQEWAQALLKIRKKDPSIYDTSTSLFHDASPAESPEDGNAIELPEGTKKPRTSKKTLRDILYDQATALEMQAVADAEGEAHDVDTDIDRKRRLREERADALAYDPEQRALRDALVTRMHAGDSDAEAGGSGQEDDLGGMTIRQRATAINATERASAAPEAAAAADLDRYFSAEGALPSGEAAFLRDYFRRRLWEEPGDHGGASNAVDLPARGPGGAPAVALEEDEEFLDRADQFEHKYNFRSEEPRGAEIRTYPRQIEGLVRQEDSRRKRQRESKRTRQDERDAQRADEVKRLKNLKKQEVGDALSKLAAVSGRGAPGKSMLKQLMDNDFDPDAWDQHMADAFGDDYYAEAEPEMDVVAAAGEAMQQAEGWTSGDDAALADGAAGSESDEEDKGEDAHAAGGQNAGVGTFDAVHQKLTGKKAGLLPETDYAQPFGRDSSGEDEEDDAEGDKVEELAESRNKIHALLQEYYNLDHEDEVGGVKTRFRYRRVAPINDGLSTEEILALPDRDLNAIVGLRKLAPYHDDTHRIRPNYKALNEAREKLIAQGLVMPKGGADKHKRRFGKDGEGKGSGQKYKLGDASAAGGGGKARRDGEGKGKDGVRTGRVEKKTRAPKAGAGAVPGDAGKKVKRPGPRLRKALKELAAAAAGGDAAVGGGNVQEAGSHGAAADAGKAGGRHEGGKKRRKALQDMDDEEKKAARLASYAPVTPGGGRSGGHGSAAAKARKSVGSDAGHQGKRADEQGDGEFAGLSKAAKKNMKRKLKRQSGAKTDEPAA